MKQYFFFFCLSRGNWLHLVTNWWLQERIPTDSHCDFSSIYYGSYFLIYIYIYIHIYTPRISGLPMIMTPHPPRKKNKYFYLVHVMFLWFRLHVCPDFCSCEFMPETQHLLLSYLCHCTTGYRLCATKNVVVSPRFCRWWSGEVFEKDIKRKKKCTSPSPSACFCLVCWWCRIKFGACILKYRMLTVIPSFYPIPSWNEKKSKHK